MYSTIRVVVNEFRSHVTIITSAAVVLGFRSSTCTVTSFLSKFHSSKCPDFPTQFCRMSVPQHIHVRTVAPQMVMSVNNIQWRTELFLCTLCRVALFSHCLHVS
jgi:hypothetical protein